MKLSRICPVTMLKIYEEHTAPVRGTETRLFLAVMYKAITSTTVARSLLEYAGSDTYQC